MNLPIIQSLWIGESLSKVERLCVQSFLDNGHEFRLYVYDEVQNIPDGCVIKDANDILPSSTIFKYKNGGYGGFSNWFRYAMLCKVGGFWVDMDVVCIKPFDFGDEFIVGRSTFSITGTAVLGGKVAVFAELEKSCRNFPKTSPWDSNKLRRRKFKMRLMRRGQEGASFGMVGGPVSLSAALKHYNLFEKAKPHTWFFPVHWENCDSIFDNTFADHSPFTQDTFAIHLWNEHWRRLGTDKNADFPRNSLLEQLKCKHKIK